VAAVADKDSTHVRTISLARFAHRESCGDLDTPAGRRGADGDDLLR
jgi:hypothetical protein